MNGPKLSAEFCWKLREGPEDSNLQSQGQRLLAVLGGQVAVEALCSCIELRPFRSDRTPPSRTKFGLDDIVLDRMNFCVQKSEETPPTPFQGDFRGRTSA